MVDHNLAGINLSELGFGRASAGAGRGLLTRRRLERHGRPGTSNAGAVGQKVAVAPMLGGLGVSLGFRPFTTAARTEVVQQIPARGARMGSEDN